MVFLIHDPKVHNKHTKASNLQLFGQVENFFAISRRYMAEILTPYNQSINQPLLLSRNLKIVVFSMLEKRTILFEIPKLQKTFSYV